MFVWFDLKSGQEQGSRNWFGVENVVKYCKLLCFMYWIVGGWLNIVV